WPTRTPALRSWIRPVRATRPCVRERRARARSRGRLDVDYHVFLGARAANQQVPYRRRLQRLGIILHRSGDQPALTGMANSGPASPAPRDVAGLGEFQQALEPGAPGDREAGAGK